MPAGPHDADDPGLEKPDDATSPASGSGPQEPAENPGDAAAGPGELEPGDVDSRWVEIVTELRGAPDPRSWAPDPAVEAAEEHFEPPDAAPVLGGDPLLTMAWSTVAGVPALLMIAVVAWRGIPAVVLQVAGVAFLLAVGILVWRMPHHHEDDSGPGAVV